jgi:hypothetical protein
MIIFDGEGGVGAAKFFFPFSSAMCKMVNYKNVKAMIKAHLGREAEADSGESDEGGQKNSREGAAISKTANCVSSFNIHFITEEEGRGHFLSAKGIWMRIAALGSGSCGNHQREDYQEERNFPSLSAQNFPHPTTANSSCPASKSSFCLTLIATEVGSRQMC